jgi:hypothetical protein
MKCEEFEEIGLGLELDGAARSGAGSIAYAAAMEHANSCARCAALQESWQAVQLELSTLRAETYAEAPQRVEMRLRQEFRTRHRTEKAQRVAVTSGWLLAAATLLIGVISWRSWHAERKVVSGKEPSLQSVNAGPETPLSGNPAGAAETARVPGTGKAPAPGATGVQQHTAKAPDGASDASPSVVAENTLDDFTLLPGAVPIESDGAAVVQVRLQRAALGALGLPVNEERAGDWVQVDLLIAEDGRPQAVRMSR